MTPNQDCCIIGIDPGYTGAISIFKNRVLQEVWEMPLKKVGKKTSLDLRQLAFMFNNLNRQVNRVAFIEHVTAMPGQGVVSMFNFGFQFGALRAFLANGAWTTHLVRPQQWKKVAGLIGKNKDASRQLALKEFPVQKDLFKLKKHHGRADAALIGYFGSVVYPNFLSQEASQ